MDYLGWILFAGLVAVLLLRLVLAGRENSNTDNVVSALLTQHFSPHSAAEITVTERQFPFRVRADLQRAIDAMFHAEAGVVHFSGVRRDFSHEGVSLPDCLVESEHSHSAMAVPPECEELDIGEDTPIRVLKNGLWLLKNGDTAYAVLLCPQGMFGHSSGLKFQVGTLNTQAGTEVAQSFFQSLEAAVMRADSYRGKILSLENSETSYTGESIGITVHKLRHVTREQVILPESTMDLLERNLITFVRHRDQLARFRQSTRKGLLFYGPPGTGKTHTIHYLTRALTDHTTLLISAEQIGLLSEYMTLARLLQPSIVVMEDVDLIARDRTRMKGPCDELMLNRLLNEMDGLKEDADIVFVLTTNRPESLEAALAARPGRIDQAIEFPLPDESGRGKLLHLYSQGVTLDEESTTEIVKRTDGVSAAFMKELMRRVVQNLIERGGDGTIHRSDVDGALEEMLFKGGSLNLRLLGAATASEQTPA